MTRIMLEPIVAATITTAIATTIIHCHPLPRILIKAQIAMIGARRNACMPWEIRMTTCVISLVDLVIRLAVENLPISSIENPTTFV